MNSNAKVLFERYMPNPKMFLIMSYLKDTKTGERLYETDHLENDCNNVQGVFCLNCGRVHEYENYKWGTPLDPCECGITPKTTSENRNCLYVNGRANGPYRSTPHKVVISELEDKIRIISTFKQWGFNAKVQKPFVKYWTATIIINTRTKQSYRFPAVCNGKAMFEEDGVKNIGFPGSDEVDLINRCFFSEDSENMKAVLDAYKRHVPETPENISDLIDLINFNHLRGLYSCFPGLEQGILFYETRHLWKLLRKRYIKDPETFPKYLTRGLKEVTPKSIRKILYAYPEQKWTLKFLYKEMGLTNIDILRSLLSERNGKAWDTYCRFYNFGFRSDEDNIRALFRMFRDANVPDKEMTEFFFSDTVRYEHIRDAARLMQDVPVTIDEIRKYKNVTAFHDYLVDEKLKRAHRDIWERNRTPVYYSKQIEAMAGECGAAVFDIIRRPCDLDALADRFHNCVYSYKQDVASKTSVIIEMKINGKPSACIELDGTGRYCLQAYAPCNLVLENEAKKNFEKWAEKWDLKSMSGQRYHNVLPF